MNFCKIDNVEKFRNVTKGSDNGKYQKNNQHDKRTRLSTNQNKSGNS